MGTPTPPETEALEAAKRASVAQLLLKAARLVDEAALARVRARTGLDVRPAHTALFPHIDLHGTRITEIARRMGISKQAVGQLVGDLEAMGAVERVPDPDDGRAKLVRFAHRGGRLSLLDGLAVLAELEARLADVLGEDRLRALHAALLDVIDCVDESA